MEFYDDINIKDIYKAYNFFINLIRNKKKSRASCFIDFAFGDEVESIR